VRRCPLFGRPLCIPLGWRTGEARHVRRIILFFPLPPFCFFFPIEPWWRTFGRSGVSPDERGFQYRRRRRGGGGSEGVEAGESAIERRRRCLRVIARPYKPKHSPCGKLRGGSVPRIIRNSTPRGETREEKRQGARNRVVRGSREDGASERRQRWLARRKHGAPKSDKYKVARPELLK